MFARNNSASDSYNSYRNNYDKMHTVFAVDSFIRIAYGNESFTFYNRPNNVIGSMLVHSYFFSCPLYTHIVQRDGDAGEIIFKGNIWLWQNYPNYIVHIK